MLKNIFKLAKKIINKNPIIFKVLLEKIFEFLIYYRIFDLRVTFLLISLLNHCFIEKKSSKKDLIWPIDPCNFEMVLIIGRNNSNLDMSCYNTSREIKSLGVASRMQSLLGVDHVLSP